MHGLYSRDPYRRLRAYHALASEIAPVLKELDRRGSKRVAAELAKAYAAGDWRRDYALQQAVAYVDAWERERRARFERKYGHLLRQAERLLRGGEE